MADWLSEIKHKSSIGLWEYTKYAAVMLRTAEMTLSIIVSPISIVTDSPEPAIPLRHTLEGFSGFLRIGTK